MNLLRPKYLAAFLAVIGLACSGDGGGPANGPTTIASNGGNNQVAPAGSQLSTPLSVLVTDQAGAAVASVVVNWAAASGGGSVGAATSTTDANGIATMSRTLGPNAGTQTTTATHSGLTGSPVTFTAIAQVQGATQIALATSNSGNAQQDTVKSTLANPYRVLVRDQTNTPVQNVIVNWKVTGGGGSLSAAKDTTDAAGIAVVTHTFGTASGAQTVQA